MKKFISIILLLASWLPAVPASDRDYKKPDYRAIKRVINDHKSEFYYPVLMQRYTNSDTTLTLQDYRILYYGYLFSEHYSAYGHSVYSDSLRPVFSQDTLTTEDFQKIIRLENRVLDEFPFDLGDLNTLTYSFLQTGDTLSAVLTNYKLNRLVETILSTGTGEKESTAWHVISIGHEYDLLDYFGFRFAGSQSLTQNGCDYLEVAPNEYDIEGFYFDVNMILDKEAELFK